VGRAQALSPPGFGKIFFARSNEREMQPYALRRFVKQDQLWSLLQPFGQYHLLLISTGQSGKWQVWTIWHHLEAESKRASVHFHGPAVEPPASLTGTSPFRFNKTWRPGFTVPG
jgi:hypothetical protein